MVISKLYTNMKYQSVPKYFILLIKSKNRLRSKIDSLNLSMHALIEDKALSGFNMHGFLRFLVLIYLEGAKPITRTRRMFLWFWNQKKTQDNQWYDNLLCIKICALFVFISRFNKVVIKLCNYFSKGIRETKSVIFVQANLEWGTGELCGSIIVRLSKIF